MMPRVVQWMLLELYPCVCAMHMLKVHDSAQQFLNGYPSYLYPSTLLFIVVLLEWTPSH